MCIWGGGGSSNRNASRDESLETGDESVETGDESVEAGEKHNNRVIIYHTIPGCIYYCHQEKYIYISQTWFILCLSNTRS